MTNPPPGARRRKPMRLATYDYATPGAYFVTLCTRDRQRFLGRTVDDRVELSPVGLAVADAWASTVEHYPSVSADEYVIMPNHLHGILWLEPTTQDPDIEVGPTLPQVIRRFKSLAALEANRIEARRGNWLWQRGYFERVIRNERELEAVRRYILENPLRADEGQESLDLGLLPR